jgi:hypothetical protein
MGALLSLGAALLTAAARSDTLGCTINNRSRTSHAISTAARTPADEKHSIKVDIKARCRKRKGRGHENTMSAILPDAKKIMILSYY